jgi:ABC-type lipoprotein export system ATPase subunit
MSPSNTQTAEKTASGTSANDNLIVHATGVHKVYQTGTVSIPALRGVNLSVWRGEMVAIMGPSGSGKTTLLNCLSGLDTADQGQISIEGISLPGMSDRERTAYRARRMGFVFQFYNLLPVLSAVENVELPLLVSGVRLRGAQTGIGVASASRAGTTRQPPSGGALWRGTAADDDCARPGKPTHAGVG